MIPKHNTARTNNQTPNIFLNISITKNHILEHDFENLSRWNGKFKEMGKIKEDFVEC